MDAIPYLVEREAVQLQVFRRHTLSSRPFAAKSTSITPTASSWPRPTSRPTDVLPYFGDGDECHIAFHFPLMPRISMALRQEDRCPSPISSRRRPTFPTCQWGLFLRNHDELTLEMVTNDERDYMYLAYSADPRHAHRAPWHPKALGAPVDNSRRRIELLISLFLPGSSHPHYGDEMRHGRRHLSRRPQRRGRRRCNGMVTGTLDFPLPRRRACTARQAQ